MHSVASPWVVISPHVTHCRSSHTWHVSLAGEGTGQATPPLNQLIRDEGNPNMVVARATRCVASLPAALCRLVLKRFASFFYSRPFQLFAPVFIGMCLGVAVNMTLVPYGKDSCETCLASQDPQDFVRVIPRCADLDLTVTMQQEQQERERKSAEGLQAGEGGGGSDDGKPPAMIQPRVVPRKQTPVPPKQRVKPILRPVFAATELGIKEKVLVGVLLSSPDSLATRGAALNRTLAPHASKTVFFLPEPLPRGASPPPGMTVVVTPPPRSVKGGGEDDVGQEAIRALRHLSKKWSDAFDFYLLLTDSAMIRGSRMRAFLETTSVGQALQLGAPSRIHRGVVYCPLQGGLVISQGLLSQVIPKLDECETHFRSADPSLNLAHCLRHAANSTCSDYTPFAKERNYSYFELATFDYDRNIDQVKREKRFNSSFSFYPVTDTKTHYKLQRYFYLLDIEEAQREMEEKRVEVARINKYMPGPEKGVSWPIGVPEPYRSKDRFDIIRWEYFTDKQIFFHEDFSNVKNLTGVDGEDIREVLELSMKRLRQLHGEDLRLVRVMNGYRRFDPTRGTEYLVDVVMENARQEILAKRAELVRPLGKVEVLRSPPASASQTLTLVLPVTPQESEVTVGSFLDEYAHVCIEKGERTQLSVVFLSPNPKAKNTFSVLKSMLAFYQKKYSKRSKIRWTEVRTNGSYVSDVVIANALTSQLKPEDLVVMISPGMELAPEFFKRVRMNVVRGWQVFFPIGFWQYKPSLIYDSTPYPKDIAVSSKTGHYDRLDREHGAFFLSDFLAARAGRGRQPLPADVFTLFLEQGSLHVLRAVDPGLKHHFRQLSCPPSLPDDVRERCQERQAKGLATRSQLARLLFQLEESRRNVTAGH